MQVLIGSRLKKARDAMGLSQGTFAKSIGLSSEYISLLEAGKRTPSFDALSRIAGFLNKEISYFFEKREPAFTVLLRGEGLDETGRAVVRKFERYCEKYLRFEELTGRRLELAPLYSHVSAERLADDERRRLGLGDEPIRDIFSLVELNGLRIFRHPLPEGSKVSGVFVFWEEKSAAFALINSAQSAGRQAFTVAHEYCHYLRDRLESPVIDNADVFIDEYVSLYSPREQFSQAFAARFLMPPVKVCDVVEKDLRPQRLNYDDVIFLKRYFGVSTAAMLRTLRNLGYMRREKFEEYFALDPESREIEVFGGLADGEGRGARKGRKAKDKPGAAGASRGRQASQVPLDAETGERIAAAETAVAARPVYSDRYRLLQHESESLKNKKPVPKEKEKKDDAPTLIKGDTDE